MRRTTLVSVSIVGHFAIGIGLFASGVWKLERLESDHRLAGIGVMTQTQAGGGGGEDLPAPKLEKKKPPTEKKIVKDVQWDKRVERDDKPTETAIGDGDGEGDGLGKGPGKGIGDGIDIDGPPCLAPPCDGGIPKPPEAPPPPAPKVHVVPPSVMGPLRLAGETQIHPTRTIKQQMLNEGKNRVVGTLKVCIGTSGAISSVSMLSSTKYSEYDALLLSTVRTWRYRPYMVDGVPQPACSPVSFVYSIK